MSRYIQILELVRVEMDTEMPHRIVSREYKDFALHDEDDLRKGVFTITPFGVSGYPYEVSDTGSGLNSHEYPGFDMQIVLQGLLPENCTGMDVDMAELSALDEIETVVARMRSQSELAMLSLGEVQMSGQIEKPYFWIKTMLHSVPLT